MLPCADGMILAASGLTYLIWKLPQVLLLLSISLSPRDADLGAGNRQFVARTRANTRRMIDLWVISPGWQMIYPMIIIKASHSCNIKFRQSLGGLGVARELVVGH